MPRRKKPDGRGGARKGAGRKADIKDSVDVTFRAPRELIDRVDAEAEHHEQSRAQALRALIADGLAER